MPPTPLPLPARGPLPPEVRAPAPPPHTDPWNTRPRLTRLHRAARAARFPLAVYGVCLVLHLVLLALLNPPGDQSVHDRLTSWDGQWFLDIARNGYPHTFAITPDGLQGGTLAFFPAYPLLVRTVHTLTFLDYDTAGLVAAHLALIAALLCIHRLLLDLYDRRTAHIATFLVACAQPMALVFLMSYSESLFLAFAAAALLALHRKHWLTAGTLILLAGLTRPVAVALMAALGVAAVLHFRREARVTWRPLTALLLSYCGVPAYVLWVAHRTGELDAWFKIQEAGWGTRWDNGDAFFSFLGDTFTKSDGWVPISTALLLLALIAATAAAWRDRVWPPLTVYGTVVLVITLGQSNFYHSKLRLLIPALIFTVPAARALARVRTSTAIITLAVAALFGSWYGAYMLTVWHFAI
ncbi:mannosyltransferase family protein [Streptomyces acidiscabies]|uniref:mannosyltransferase family protein n=1 Tax=Streptomyces acidiscabies TaxID=42234 RepID=UPI00073E201F|nr:mannosyltransferase family protein [Streptomyces acidiscabies]GAQ58016.1 mannosyltransferase [Streptomyces acidiscabies]GAV44526.1 mannosyltransferase [Streptomyces acidiscabies]